MINNSQIIRYLSNESTQDERVALEEWLVSNTQNQEEFDLIHSIWKSEDANQTNRMQLEADWDRLSSTIRKSENIDSSQKPYKLMNSWLVKAAAIIILVLGSGIIWYSQKDIVNIRGTKSEPVAYLLPDGSEVFLTYGSKLKYSRNFNKEQRIVELFGEAYFNVTSNPKDPFIVDTGEAKARVTGTSFLVSAQDRNEEVAVQVKAGKVLFYNSETLTKNSFRVGLGPGDKGTYKPKLNQLNKTRNKDFNYLNTKS
ncbi:MAG: FecR domain-containing protein [Bacteroidales bacterium]|nr:FecR domain-containing protein [Bacteroidales bacterium]